MIGPVLRCAQSPRFERCPPRGARSIGTIRTRPATCTRHCPATAAIIIHSSTTTCPTTDRTSTTSTTTTGLLRTLLVRNCRYFSIEQTLNLYFHLDLIHFLSFCKLGAFFRIHFSELFISSEERGCLGCCPDPWIATSNVLRLPIWEILLLRILKAPNMSDRVRKARKRTLKVQLCCHADQI